MNHRLRERLGQREVWLRGLFMLLFALIYSIAEIVIASVAVFQFLSLLITGSTNERLLGFGRSLSVFVYQVMRYLTFNSEQRPWPFGDWPGDEDEEGGNSPQTGSQGHSQPS